MTFTCSFIVAVLFFVLGIGILVVDFVVEIRGLSLDKPLLRSMVYYLVHITFIRFVLFVTNHCCNFVIHQFDVILYYRQRLRGVGDTCHPACVDQRVCGLLIPAGAC